MYVVSSSGMFGEAAIPADFPDRASQVDGLSGSKMPIGDGSAVICSPSGKVLAHGEAGDEQIVYADIDIAATVMPRSGRDQGGHYHRPDVFDLTIDRSRRVPASFKD